MSRILAIDYGKKRVGIAVTDTQQIIANKLTTVPTYQIWDFLKEYFEKEDVEKVVIGYPRQLNNQPSESIRYINPFLRRFQKVYPQMHIEQIDERYTSKIAFQTMIDGGLKKKARQNKALVDAVSATIILQTYMDQEKFKK
ncbi:MAG: Holliday junction resolvase RuvX [Prolixibacteraceae bacterium]|nr:Holliday junction resolvase RuvX [Prolixibacteraceae bacterium]